MRGIAVIAAALAGSSIVAAAPAQAQGCWGPQAVQAVKLHRLDAMLRVAAGQCGQEFRADYQAFAAAHRGDLLAAEMVLADQLGPERAGLAISQGDPALGCRELRSVAHDLAATTLPTALLDAAEALVATPPEALQGCRVRVSALKGLDPVRVAATR